MVITRLGVGGNQSSSLAARSPVLLTRCLVYVTYQILYSTTTTWSMRIPPRTPCLVRWGAVDSSLTIDTSFELRYWRLMHIVCYNVQESSTNLASTSIIKVRLLKLLLLWRHQHRWEPTSTSAIILIFLVLLGVDLTTFDRSALSLLRWHVQGSPLVSFSWRCVCLGLLLLTVSLDHHYVWWSIWRSAIEAVTSLLLHQTSSEVWYTTITTTATYQKAVWNGSFWDGSRSSSMGKQTKLSGWPMFC